MNKLLRLLAVLAAASLLVALGFLAFDFLQTREKFPPQTLIGEANVSGLYKNEAVELLRSHKSSDLFTPVVTFEVERTQFNFSPEAIGIFVDYEDSIARAFSITHKENYLKELRERLKRGPVRYPLTLKVDDQTLTEVLDAIGGEIRSTSQDASVVLYEESGGYHIESEELGRELNLEETKKVFNDRLALNAKIFPIVVNYLQPHVTEMQLRAAPPVHRLSAYTTFYGKHDSPNRIHNIKLIASWLNGSLLLPGEEFSLAEKIGDFTADRGFKEACVIYEGVLVPQLGGGTCQIGTTLYNAAALADLDILQRQNHSFYFNIYPLGRDATVYPGQKDLVFKNNTDHPILIKAVATNKRLSFRVYGTPTGKSVKFSPPTVYILTKSGYRPSTVREVLAADVPFKTVLTRTVYGATGKVLKEETLNSAYKLYGEKTNVPIARPEPR